MSPSLPRSMYRRDSPVVIYSYPSDDHTYSMARVPQLPPSATPGSDVDEEYDWGSDDDCDSFSDTSAPESEFSECDSDGEGRVSPGKRKRKSYGTSSSTGLYASPVKRRLIEAADDDEEMKIVEGADALLNLAGIRTARLGPLRAAPHSSSSSSNNNNNNNKDSIKDMSGLVGRSAAKLC